MILLKEGDCPEQLGIMFKISLEHIKNEPLRPVFKEYLENQ